MQDNEADTMPVALRVQCTAGAGTRPVRPGDVEVLIGGVATWEREIVLELRRGHRQGQGGRQIQRPQRTFPQRWALLG